MKRVPKNPIPNKHYNLLFDACKKLGIILNLYSEGDGHLALGVDIDGHELYRYIIDPFDSIDVAAAHAIDFLTQEGVQIQ